MIVTPADYQQVYGSTLPSRTINQPGLPNDWIAVGASGTIVSGKIDDGLTLRHTGSQLFDGIAYNHHRRIFAVVEGGTGTAAWYSKNQKDFFESSSDVTGGIGGGTQATTRGCVFYHAAARLFVWLMNLGAATSVDGITWNFTTWPNLINTVAFGSFNNAVFRGAKYNPFYESGWCAINGQVNGFQFIKITSSGIGQVSFTPSWDFDQSSDALCDVTCNENGNMVTGETGNPAGRNQYNTSNGVWNVTPPAAPTWTLLSSINNAINGDLFNGFFNNTGAGLHIYIGEEQRTWFTLNDGVDWFVSGLLLPTSNRWCGAWSEKDQIALLLDNAGNARTSPNGANTFSVYSGAPVRAYRQIWAPQINYPYPSS